MIGIDLCGQPGLKQCSRLALQFDFKSIKTYADYLTFQYFSAAPKCYITYFSQFITLNLGLFWHYYNQTMFTLISLVLLITTALACPENCYSCFTGSEFCIVCKDTYELAVNGACISQSMVPYCTLFQSQNFCLNCQPTYRAINGTCIKLYDGCLTYDTYSNTCTQCSFGTKLLNGSCIGTVQCAQQSENCSSCKVGWQLKNGLCFDNTGNCLKTNQKGLCLTCKDNYNLVGYTCISKEVYTTQCYIYNDKGKCLFCKESFAQYEGQCLDFQEFQDVRSGKTTVQAIISKRISENIKNSHMSVDPKPQTTSIQNSSNITPPISNPNPIPTITTYSSTPVIPHCLVSDNSRCTSCADGYFLTSQQQCQILPNNCQSADRKTLKCVRCNEGFEFNPKNDCITSPIKNCAFADIKGVCWVCNEGLTLISSQCVPEIPHCYKYDNKTFNCMVCNSAYNLVNNSCLLKNCKTFDKGTCVNCIDEYFLNSNGLCQHIGIPFCLQLNKQKQCIRCEVSYSLNLGECISQQKLAFCSYFNNSLGKCTTCNQNYTLNPKSLVCELNKIETPVPVKRDQNCLKSNPDNTCLTCSNNYYYSVNQSRCVPVNPQCKTYDPKTGACITCFPGYVISANNCIVGISADPYCLLFDQNKLCVKCYSGYFLKDIKCSLLNILCKTWNMTNGACLSCYPGYSLSQGNCTISYSDPNCLKADLAGKCLTCNNASYLDSSGKCKSANPLCKGFDSTGNCLDCYLGYTLSGGNCITTSVNDTNCIKLLNGICQGCYKGYYLSPSNICVQIDPLCKNFDDTAKACTECYQGYSLVNGACTLVKANSQCKTVDNNGSCVDCYDGYLLVSGDCQPIGNLLRVGQ